MIIIKNKIFKILIYWKVQLCEGGSCLMQMQRGSANAPCHSLFLLFLFGNHHHHDFPHCWWQWWWWQIRWKQQRWALKGSAAAQSGHGGQAGKSNHLSILTMMMMMIMMMTILMTEETESAFLGDWYDKCMSDLIEPYDRRHWYSFWPHPSWLPPSEPE